MIREYHNHTLQANPWHHEEKQHNLFVIGTIYLELDKKLIKI